MAVVFISMLIIVLHLLSVARTNSVPYYEKYFDQTLDHFNYYWEESKPSTFKQRYLYQDKWWDRGSGPIFFYTGNEGDIVTFWKNTGFMFELAPKFHAVVLFMEHRFYGKSLPFGKQQSFEHPYVDLLTVEQALADYAVFLDWFKYSFNCTTCNIITFGGSYGGMLSADMRFKYPNLVTGSIAASAPIFLTVGLASREAFFEDVTKDFRDAVPGCENQVRRSFIKMADLASQGESGLKALSTTFNLCPALNSTDQVPHFIGWIRNAFANMAMFDYPYETVVMTVLPGYPVKVACQKLTDSKDPLDGLRQVVGLWYGTAKCSDIWSEYVECSDPTGCGTGPAGKAWSYQACTDFIMPDGTNNVTDMFPVLTFSLQQRLEYCQKRWGIKPRDQWTRVNLWGQDIKSASNIVFSNGKLDPWQRGGVLSNISENVVAVIIDDSAHHLDLRSSNPVDPPSVTKARQIETDWIRKWLSKV